MNRRDFLKALGIGAAAIAAPALIVEPEKKLWFVGSNAPVGSRVERLDEPCEALYGHELERDYAEAIEFARRLKQALYAQQERDALELNRVWLDELSREGRMAARLEYGAENLRRAQASWERNIKRDWGPALEDSPFHSLIAKG